MAQYLYLTSVVCVSVRIWGLFIAAQKCISDR